MVWVRYVMVNELHNEDNKDYDIDDNNNNNDNNSNSLTHYIRNWL